MGASRWLQSCCSLLQSFKDLFVEFLEKESSPQPQARLPAQQMAEEKQHPAAQRAVFNPFSVPINTTPGGTLPLRVPSSSSGSTMSEPLPSATSTRHPLMHMSVPSSTVPLLAPSNTSATSSSSSGSSNILKDVLQQ